MPKWCESRLKCSCFSGFDVWRCDFVKRFGKCGEGFWKQTSICYVPLLMFYAVNELWLALEFIRIFILTSSSGIGNWRCVPMCLLVRFECLCASVFAWFVRCVLIFFHLMVCYRWSTFLICLTWVLQNQVSVLNHRLPKYGIYVMYTRAEHVVPWYRLHGWLSIWLLIVIVESVTARI